MSHRTQTNRETHRYFTTPDLPTPTLREVGRGLGLLVVYFVALFFPAFLVSMADSGLLLSQLPVAASWESTLLSVLDRGGFIWQIAVTLVFATRYGGLRRVWKHPRSFTTPVALLVLVTALHFGVDLGTHVLTYGSLVTEWETPAEILYNSATLDTHWVAFIAAVSTLPALYGRRIAHVSETLPHLLAGAVAAFPFGAVYSLSRQLLFHLSDTEASNLDVLLAAAWEDGLSIGMQTLLYGSILVLVVVGISHLEARTTLTGGDR